MKSIQTLSTLISLVLWLLLGYSFVVQKETLPEKHIEIVMRDIGHRLLLVAKDSTSKVLPIEKINAHTYQISFENAFKFVSDSLINTVRRQMAKHDLPQDYMVSVLNCQKFQTIFAYEISSSKNDILACQGRNQDTACYLIRIEFLKSRQSQPLMVLAALLTLGLGGLFWYMRKRKSSINDATKPDAENREVPTEDLNAASAAFSSVATITESVLSEGSTPTHLIKIGLITFNPDKNRLMHDDTTIALSDRETKLLRIFTDHINEVVQREHLVKEVWEDEGIFVMSRNLDVFVSKLRKKLVSDPAIKIVNVHGKGYRLMVD